MSSIKHPTDCVSIWRGHSRQSTERRLVWHKRTRQHSLNAADEWGGHTRMEPCFCLFWLSTIATVVCFGYVTSKLFQLPETCFSWKVLPNNLHRWTVEASLQVCAYIHSNICNLFRKVQVPIFNANECIPHNFTPQSICSLHSSVEQNHNCFIWCISNDANILCNLFQERNCESSPSVLFWGQKIDGKSLTISTWRAFGEWITS